jgi:apocytochrome f
MTNSIVALIEMRNVFLTARLTRSARAIVKTLLIAIATVTFYFTSDLALPQSAAAYPFWAQQLSPSSQGYRSGSSPIGAT